MKHSICMRRGYLIYVWTTGKFEAYLNDKPTSISGSTLHEVIDQIDAGFE